VYDAGGNVLLQKDPGKTTLFLFGGAEQLVLNTGTGAVTGTRFLALPGGGQVVRTGAGTAYSFEVGDQHGTSLLTLDNTAANPVWRQYTPYGAARGTAPSSWPDINAFLGKPADTATGLDLLGARQYDPATGRFLSPDPVLDPASPQTLNGYSYAAGNPVTQADPTGLCIYSWCPPPPAHGTAPTSKYGPGSGGGGNGYNPAPSPGAGCQNSPTGCFSGSAGPIGEQPSGPGAPPPPDLHPVAASYTSSGSAVGSVNSPGCNGFLFKYGACPSESGAAGTTPQEVRQSAIGAAGILLGAFPIGDFLDLAIGSATEAGAEAGTGSVSGSALARSGLNAEQRVEQNIGVGRNAGVGRTTIPGSGSGGFRVPDFNPTLTIAARGSVVEVKDVAQLSATPQLRDLVSYAQGRVFH
jgi:RHS repeat-associated protein